MVTKVCAAVLSTTSLVIPPDDQRSMEEFNSRAALWANYQTYPDQVHSALSVWLKDVADNPVEGEVIELSS